MRGAFLSTSSEENSHCGRVNKVPRKGKNSHTHEIRGEYVRRVRRGFRRFADGNRAFSIGGFVAFIPARRHKLGVATRRVRDAPLFLFARERRYFQRAPRRDARRHWRCQRPFICTFHRPSERFR